MSKGKKITKYLAIISILFLVSIIAFKVSKSNNVVEEPDVMVSKGYQEVQASDEKIDNTDYVTFDAFYLKDLDGDGYAEKIRGTCQEIGKRDTLYMDLNVLTNGTLKDAKIRINGRNFYFATALVKDGVISKDYISQNTKQIVLNDVPNGTQKLIFGLVQSGDYTYNLRKADAIDRNINNYSVNNNTITLTGTHVADDGTETPITKTITLTNDWYGTTKASFYMGDDYRNQSYLIDNAIDEENQLLKIIFKLNPMETDYKLLISNNHVEGDLPELNGYLPTDVTCSVSGAEVTYDSSTGKFMIDNRPTVSEFGNVINSIGTRVYYNITAYYPLEAYTTMGEESVSFDIPVRTWFEGYNNPNGEFENPYISNVAKDTIGVVYKKKIGAGSAINLTVGKSIYDETLGYTRYIISKKLPLCIYNDVETGSDTDKYIVRWYVTSGNNVSNVPMVVKETPDIYFDRFQNTSSEYINMQNYVSNIGIYFYGVKNMLAEDGYINVYNDETNELIHTFMVNECANYTEDHPYLYDEAIKHIRVETSNVNGESSFTVYNVKRIDDTKLTADYTLEEFENLIRIYSYVSSYTKNGDELNIIDSDFDYADYEAPYSLAEITFGFSSV